MKKMKFKFQKVFCVVVWFVVVYLAMVLGACIFGDFIPSKTMSEIYILCTGLLMLAGSILVWLNATKQERAIDVMYAFEHEPEILDVEARTAPKKEIKYPQREDKPRVLYDCSNDVNEDKPVTKKAKKSKEVADANKDTKN
jgi:hypothetical protein